MERIVADQLMEYLETNKLISNTQHGFRSKLSTETALLAITEKIYENMDNNKISLLSLLDLSKAFDSVNGRTQSVKIDNHISSKVSIDFGVPQGSILCPILFIIYVNNMSQFDIGYQIEQFADDTQILLIGTIDEINQLVKETENTL